MESPARTHAITRTTFLAGGAALWGAAIFGKLIYLQVYTRGRWSTFATPRANPVSGLWNEAYRFSATRGLVRYRFRVLVPREASFPYETGTSPSVRVTVRGL